MSEEANNPDQNKPAEVIPPAQENKPAEAKPATAEAKSAAPATNTAAAEAKPAEPAAPAVPLTDGAYGKLLKEKNINSIPLPASMNVETLELQGSDLLPALKILREQAKLDFLVAVSGVDSQDTFDSVYHLWSFTKQDELVVKVRVTKTSIKENYLPEVPSVSNYWQTADWHERETYDLVGIRYIGHRYLRRILNPWDWEGHPLRRDYKQPVDALNDKHPVSMR
jgi:NADH-quinone oxidoreductase subunit C